MNCKQTKGNEISEKDIVHATEEEKKVGKNAEIVFCLDATGSMGGLIGTAKEKIWDIVSDLAQSNDVDTLKMGMVFYRDIGDSFVTKQIALTADLDEVYSDLLEMNADGGGDSPESVNQALHESVTDMAWSNDPNTYRTIFVVGDCPPHMDYQGDVPYTVSCKKALEKGIHINTIKLGSSCTQAIAHFKKMASCTNGEFLRLDQNASDYVIDTPYDDDINEESRKIDDSRLYYGDREEQEANNLKKRKSIDLYEKSSKTANSARASYKASKSGDKSWMGSKEIVKDFKSGKINVEELADEELPVELQGKTEEEKKEILNDIVIKRDESKAKLKELSLKRKQYIKEKKKENSKKDSTSFSGKVLGVMKKQAKKKDSI